MSIFKDHDGVWKWRKKPKDAYPAYSEFIEYCLNIIDTVFSRAKEVCEFEFIMCLLRVRGLQDAGWDPYYTLHDVYNAFVSAKRKIKDQKEVTHIALFLYGLIIEASEPYEIIANLLNVIEGGSFKIVNFPSYIDTNGRHQPQHPLTKIQQLQSRAKKQKFNLSFYNDFVDNKLRNAIFHSDYILHWPEIRASKKYTHDEWMTIINKAMAYYEAFDAVHKLHIRTYDKPTLVDTSPTFSHGRLEKGVTIVRREHGLIGIRHNWTDEEIKNGRIPWQICNYLPYEDKMIQEGKLIMPPSRVDFANRLIKRFPKFMRPRMVAILSKYYVNR